MAFFTDAFHYNSGHGSKSNSLRIKTILKPSAGTQQVKLSIISICLTVGEIKFKPVKVDAEEITEQSKNFSFDSIWDKLPHIGSRQYATGLFYYLLKDKYHHLHYFD